MQDVPGFQWIVLMLQALIAVHDIVQRLRLVRTKTE